MARRKVRPGDPDFRGGVIGEYWEEKGEGKVVALTTTPSGREISTSPARRGGRNAMLAVEAFHLDDPISLTVDTQDPSLPRVVRHQPESLIDHEIGYCSIVRRTQAFVESRTLEPPTTNVDLPIQKVPGLGRDGSVFKVRELVQLFEIDGKPSEQFKPEGVAVGRSFSDGGIRERVVAGDGSTISDGPGVVDYGFGTRERIRSQSALEAHLSVALMADRHLRLSLRIPGPQAYGMARGLAYDVVNRVARMIDRDGPDPESPSYVVARDLVDAALFAFPFHQNALGAFGAGRDTFEQQLLSFAEELHEQVSAWGLEYRP